MFCNNCGSQVEEGAKFCQHCGAIVVDRAKGQNPEQPSYTHEQPNYASKENYSSQPYQNNEQNVSSGSDYYQHNQYGQPGQNNQPGPQQYSQYNPVPPQYQQPNQYGYAQPVQQKPGAGFGIASLVMSLVSIFLFPIILSILALIFGIIGVAKNSGKGMAIAGIIISAIVIVIYIILIVMGVSLLATMGYLL